MMDGRSEGARGGKLRLRCMDILPHVRSGTHSYSAPALTPPVEPKRPLSRPSCGDREVTEQRPVKQGRGACGRESWSSRWRAREDLFSGSLFIFLRLSAQSLAPAVRLKRLVGALPIL